VILNQEGKTSNRAYGVKIRPMSVLSKNLTLALAMQTIAPLTDINRVTSNGSIDPVILATVQLQSVVHEFPKEREHSKK